MEGVCGVCQVLDLRPLDGAPCGALPDSLIKALIERITLHSLVQHLVTNLTISTSLQTLFVRLGRCEEVQRPEGLGECLRQCQSTAVLPQRLSKGHTDVSTRQAPRREGHQP